MLNNHSPELNSPIFSDFTAESSIGFKFKDDDHNNKISNKNNNKRKIIPQKTSRHLIRAKPKKNKINVLKYKSNDDVFKPSKQIPFHPSLKQRSSAAISYAQPLVSSEDMILPSLDHLRDKRQQDIIIEENNGLLVVQKNKDIKNKKKKFIKHPKKKPPSQHQNQNDHHSQQKNKPSLFSKQKNHLLKTNLNINENSVKSHQANKKKQPPPLKTQQPKFSKKPVFKTSQQNDQKKKTKKKNPFFNQNNNSDNIYQPIPIPWQPTTTNSNNINQDKTKTQRYKKGNPPFFKPEIINDDFDSTKNDIYHDIKPIPLNPLKNDFKNPTKEVSNSDGQQINNSVTSTTSVVRGSVSVTDQQNPETKDKKSSKKVENQLKFHKVSYNMHNDTFYNIHTNIDSLKPKTTITPITDAKISDNHNKNFKNGRLIKFKRPKKHALQPQGI